MAGKPSLTDQPTALEAEILGEKIATYVRIARTLERLVSELQEAERQVIEARGAQRRERVEVFNTLRRRAERQFWYLLVQREALGLRRHEGLEQYYPIPAPISR